MEHSILARLLDGMAAPVWMTDAFASATDAYKITVAVGTVARLWLPQTGTDAIRVAGMAATLDTPQMRADRWFRAQPASMKDECFDGIHETIVCLDVELATLVAPGDHVVWCERRDEVASAVFMRDNLASAASIVKDLRELDTRARAVVPVRIDTPVTSPRLAAVKRLDVDGSAWWASWIPTTDEE